MGAVRKYHVTHNGYRTIMKLDDADVKLYPDAEPVDESPAESEAGEAGEAGGKASTPVNKGRTAANKSKGS